MRDLDTVMLNSLGLRLACVGIVEAAQMGGGPRGAEGLFDLLRDSFAKIDLGGPDWSREAMQPLYDEAEDLYGLPARPELVARRDARLKAVLEIRERLL